MNPDIYQPDASYQQDAINARKAKQLRLMAVILFVVLLALGGFKLYQLSQFRVISTNPDVSDVAALTPFFNIKFNRQLSDQGLSVSADNSIINSYKVNGDTINIDLNNSMNVGQEYTITIQNVSDTDGATISNKNFTFSPKDIPIDQLPDDQQQALKNKKPPKADQEQAGPAFNGFSSLVDHGLTTDQTNILTQAFSDFAPKATTITVDPNSIAAAPHNPNVDVTFATNFNVTINSTKYRAVIRYADTESLELLLYNPATGKLVYDSGTVS